MLEQLYTTGKMIDKLEVGEKAETENGKYRATKTEHGMVVIQNEHGNVGLNAIVLSSMWRIIPSFVDFLEAMNAYKIGKSVIFYDCGTKVLFDEKRKNMYLSEMAILDGYSFKELLNGKWIIVD